MSTSADQVARLLALIPYLQARPGITLTEAAAAFSLTEKQLMGDLWVAFMCGLPGGMPGDLIEVDMDAVEGEGVIRLSNADILSKPLRLAPHEVGTLRLALQAVREVAAPESYAAIDSASAKLATMSWQEGPTAVVSIVTGDEAVRQALVDAMEARRQVRLTYEGGARGETTRPVVDPVALVVRDGAAYLEAWSLDRDGWRSYRLDRVAAVEVTGADAADHGRPPVRDGWLSEASIEVTLRVQESARWVSEYYPTVRTSGDLVTLRVLDPAWLRQLVLRLGGAAEVVEPLAAQDEAVLAAREALRRHEEWSRTSGREGSV
ncbi:MAG: WYL domain-containing protein [Actinobacteria bacterium]|nr:WYL domain-containing protein [Actinomycetota bacterium]